MSIKLTPLKSVELQGGYDKKGKKGLTNYNISTNDNSSQVVNAFFQQPTTLQISFALFEGYYLRKPLHTCQRFASATAYDASSISVQLHSNRYWRDRATGTRCEGCFYEHVHRICLQIEAEMNLDPDFGYATITGKQFRKVKDSHKYQQKKITLDRYNKEEDSIIISKSGKFRYVAFPQHLGTIFLVHNSPEVPNTKGLPYQYDRFYSLISDAVSNMAPNSKCSKSNGFGLHYKGAYGDNRDDNEKPTSVASLTFIPNTALIEAMQPYRVSKSKYKIDVNELKTLLVLHKVKFREY